MRCLSSITLQSAFLFPYLFFSWKIITVFAKTTIILFLKSLACFTVWQVLACWISSYHQSQDITRNTFQAVWTLWDKVVFRKMLWWLKNRCLWISNLLSPCFNFKPKWKLCGKHVYYSNTCEPGLSHLTGTSSKVLPDIQMINIEFEFKMSFFHGVNTSTRLVKKSELVLMAMWINMIKNGCFKIQWI